jgi:hypothetical protein
MNKILVNQEELSIAEKDFPILIHGEEGSGASLYTITVAVNLFSQGFPIVFLCGYPMAEEELKKQIDGVPYKDQVIFFTQDEISKFKNFLNNTNNAERIIFVKNIELFKEDVFSLILPKNKIVLSGDIDKCSFKEKILNIKFNTQVFFSPLNNVVLPTLKKYEGFFTSDNLKGITKVKIG